MDNMKRPKSTCRRQAGVIMPFAAIAMVALIGAAGYAVDMGHMFWNKSRLQNALDAAALNGAKTLNDGASLAIATAAAVDTFNSHAEGEMDDVVPTIEFSATLDPFAAGADVPDARFVRASVDDFDMGVWLIRVLGFGPTETIAGSAVAGPSPPIGTEDGDDTCDVVPVMICAKPGYEGDKDCSDGECYGYPVGEEDELCLKTGPEGPGGLCADEAFSIGAGNFQFLELGCGSGASCVKQELAGGEYCVTTGEPTSTQPGNIASARQGLNTRFGIYLGGMSPSDGLPDTVTNWNAEGADNDFWFDDYVSCQNSGGCPGVGECGDTGCFNAPPSGDSQRRRVSVPIGPCTGDEAGKADIDVLGVGCLFLTRPMAQPPEFALLGQLVPGGACQANGDIGEDPGSGEDEIAPIKIILYKDYGPPASQDS